MICPHCNSENADGAVFCASCGQRLDGKVKCPTCGTFVDSTVAFCPTCGANLKAAPQTAAPATPVAPAATATPAAPAADATPIYAAPVPAAPVAPTLKGQLKDYTGWKKIVLLVGGICALVSVILSFVFTFLIGVMPSGLTSEMKEMMDEMDITYNYNIGYFYGGVWKEVFEMFDASNVNVFKIISLLLKSMYGTLILAGFEIAMLVIVIKAIIRFVQWFKGTNNKGIEKITIGGYFVYVLACSLILSIMAISSKTTFDGETSGSTMGFNTATTLGLTFSGILVGIFVVSRLIVKGKDLLKMSTLIPTVVALVGVAFAAVAVALVSGTLFGSSRSEDGISVSMYFAFLPFIGELGANINDIDEVANGILTMLSSVAGQAFVFVLISVTVPVLAKFVGSIAEDKYKGGLGVAITSVIFAVFSMMFCFFVYNEENRELVRGLNDLNASFAPIIIGLVMSVLSLACVIAHKVICNKMAAKAQNN